MEEVHFGSENITIMSDLNKNVFANIPYDLASHFVVRRDKKTTRITL